MVRRVPVVVDVHLHVPQGLLGIIFELEPVLLVVVLGVGFLVDGSDLIEHFGSFLEVFVLQLVLVDPFYLSWLPLPLDCITNCLLFELL